MAGDRAAVEWVMDRDLIMDRLAFRTEEANSPSDPIEGSYRADGLR